MEVSVLRWTPIDRPGDSPALSRPAISSKKAIDNPGHPAQLANQVNPTRFGQIDPARGRNPAITETTPALQRPRHRLQPNY
jgi:hypothetical protein